MVSDLQNETVLSFFHITGSLVTKVIPPSTKVCMHETLCKPSLFTCNFKIVQKSNRDIHLTKTVV